MSKLENFQLKRHTSDMEETNSESDREINCQFIEGDDIAKVRENLRWKVLVNTQVTFKSKYVIFELLESCKHFDLYRAFCLSNKEKVVIKIIDKQAIKQSLRSNFIQNKAEIQNQEFLKKLKFQIIAENKLYNRSSGIFLTQPIEVYENQTCFMKITQNYYGESLQSIIKKRQSFPVQQALAVLKQIIFTLFELHKQGIILTQLNPKSIVYRNGTFKINDFSSMRKVSQKFSSTLNLCYSYSYEDVLAPQIVICPEIIDIKTEIWALGVLFYQMVENDVPYEQRSSNIVKQARSHCIKLNLKKQDFNQEITDLLRQMMEINPDERISWKKLINSEILTKKEFFYTPKMLPMIDTRILSLKKKQGSTIPQQVINNDFNKFAIKKQDQQTQQISKVCQLNIVRAFSIIDEAQKINTEQYLDLQEDTFKQIKEINLMALKTKWIRDEIIAKLQEEGMVNVKRRSHVEMMCLLTDRCQYYMRRTRILCPLTQDPRLDNYIEQLKQLQNEVRELQFNYKQLYKNLNSSPFYVLSSIIKIKHKNKHDFFTKQEGLDFSLEQQVDHTQQLLVNKIISETSPKNHQQYILLQKLKYYSKINRITQENLQKYFDFTHLVNDVLKIKNH